MGILLYVAEGIPYEIEFIGIFSLIWMISVWCIRLYFCEMEEVCFVLRTQKAGKDAVQFYENYCLRTPFWIFLLLLACPVIYSICGCQMYGEDKTIGSFVWGMVLFCAVIYVSMVGYLLYFSIIIFLGKLKSGGSEYAGMAEEEFIPVRVNWLQRITSLYHIYRTAFFILGSLYVIAYSLFCILPGYKTDRSNISFHVLWAVIIIGIVVAFPISWWITVQKIKGVVVNLKECYINEILRKQKKRQSDNPSDERLECEKYVGMQIMDMVWRSNDYPVSSMFDKFFSGGSIILNMALAANFSNIDLLQGFIKNVCEYLRNWGGYALEL